ncbi:MAG: response regulator transcription factor [Pseudomonadota bacterium]
MKILVVDDHVLIREALRGVLMELEPGATVVEARDGRQAIARTAECPPPDLVLLDIRLPDRDGLDVLAEVRERWPQIAVVMLSADQDKATISKALALGAVGFVPKSAQREVMLGAFKLMLAGGVYVPPEILVGAHERTERSERLMRTLSAAQLGLTERQLEVLRLMMRGRSNKAICRSLGLAEPTVKNHVTAILKALNATNRTEAVVAASAFGLPTEQREN